MGRGLLRSLHLVHAEIQVLIVVRPDYIKVSGNTGTA